MTLEQLQKKTDKELNRIAAVHILWGGIVNVPSDEWNPTNDMNDAMRLVKILFQQKYLRLRLEMGESHRYFAQFISNTKPHAMIIANDSSPSRAITIAAILAKENQHGPR